MFWGHNANMAKGPPPAFQALTISLAVSIRFSLAEEVFLRPHSTPGHFPDSSQLPKLYSSPPTLPDSRGEERHGLMLVRFLFPRLYVLPVIWLSVESRCSIIKLVALREGAFRLHGTTDTRGPRAPWSVAVVEDSTAYCQPHENHRADTSAENRE